MKVKVHWIIDGIAEIEADSLESAEQEVHATLTEFMISNPNLTEKLGARALQGKAYLPGSDEDNAAEKASPNGGTKLSSIIVLAFALLASSISYTPYASAAGRTYEPSNEIDPRSRVEKCRLKKLERTPEGNNCIYQRQGGGRDKVIGVENSTKCQREFLCKRVD